MAIRARATVVAMRIVVGSDDEGATADAVVDELRARGHDVTVSGARSVA